MNQQPEDAQPVDANSACDSNETGPGPDESREQAPADKLSQSTEDLPESTPPNAASVTDGTDAAFDRVMQTLNKTILFTLLDNEACRQVVSRLISHKKSQVQEHTAAPGKFQLPQDPVPPERSRKASVCKSSWDNMVGTTQIRYCSQCKSFAYDFTGMSLEEADKLVFQREEKESPIFFRRKDGKLLTRDCPVGLAQFKKKIVSTIAAGLLLMAIPLLLLLVSQLVPPQPTQDQTQAGQTETTSPQSDASSLKPSGTTRTMGQNQPATTSSGQELDFPVSDLPESDLPPGDPQAVQP